MADLKKVYDDLIVINLFIQLFLDLVRTDIQFMKRSMHVFRT